MKYWDNIAQGNRTYYSGDFDNQIRILATKMVEDGESLLDVGCGAGMMLGMLKKLNRKVKYKGIDYSEEFIKRSKENFPDDDFSVQGAEDLYIIPDNSYDVVYMRHCLENIRDWRYAVNQMFRIAKKRVVIDLRRSFTRANSKIVEDLGDTVCWDIDGEEFNHLCRNLSVNVSYLEANAGEWIGDSQVFVVIGKKMDDGVFTLDDFHENNHQLDLLHKMKKRFPNLKVTLFTIPAKCSVEWLKDVKEDWMEYAVHGWFHDITNRANEDASLYPEECLTWSCKDANKYLKKAEDMGVFIKGFKAPGWGMNAQTYNILQKRNYWCMDNKDRTHERPDWFINYYESGHLWEVNGHIQFTAFNGLEELASERKCNLHKNTNFYFVSEVVNTPKDNLRLDKIYEQISKM